jgi:DNA helicase HerA-like ATPase
MAKVFIAGIEEIGYETYPETIGVYSSRELAEKAILAKLREEEEVSSLEEYDDQDETLYDWFIEEWEVDK